MFFFFFISQTWIPLYLLFVLLYLYLYSWLSWSDARSIQPEAQLKSAEKKTYTELASENGVGCLSRYRKRATNKTWGATSSSITEIKSKELILTIRRGRMPLEFESWLTEPFSPYGLRLILNELSRCHSGSVALFILYLRFTRELLKYRYMITN